LPLQIKVFNQSSEGFCIEEDVFDLNTDSNVQTRVKSIAAKYRDLLCGMLKTDVLHFIALDGDVRGSNKMKLAPLHQKLRLEVEGIKSLKNYNGLYSCAIKFQDFSKSMSSTRTMLIKLEA
jgi:hypothetical protein